MLISALWAPVLGVPPIDLSYQGKPGNSRTRQDFLWRQKRKLRDRELPEARSLECHSDVGRSEAQPKEC
jgi:hypothetical protein